MQFHLAQWLRRNAKRLLTDAVKKQEGPSRRRQARLTVEGLEERVVPATTLTPGTEGLFVQSLYRDVLGREGGQDEVAGYVGRLRAGLSAEQLVDGFLHSTEYLSRRVDALYLNAFERHADPAGLQGNVGLLRQGASERMVLANLLDSPEYSALHPGNDQFVDALYQDGLDRPAD